MDILLGTPLSSYARGKTACDEVVLHESVTFSRAATVDVLRARKLGVHFIVAPDGSVTQHAPVEHACAHAGTAHNARSIAIEVVNPYYAPRGAERTLDGPWVHHRQSRDDAYRVPPPVQVESVWQLVRKLCREHDIPLTFPGTSVNEAPPPTSPASWLKSSWHWLIPAAPAEAPKPPVTPPPTYIFTWGRIPKHKVPGVMAHHRWDHADGLFPEHYCLARHLGHPPEDAYRLTLAAAATVPARSRETVLVAPRPSPPLAGTSPAPGAHA